MPRKCLRVCSNCGEKRVCGYNNHKINGGMHCGVFRVADREHSPPRDISVNKDKNKEV